MAERAALRLLPVIKVEVLLRLCIAAKVMSCPNESLLHCLHCGGCGVFSAWYWWCFKRSSAADGVTQNGFWSLCREMLSVLYQWMGKRECWTFFASQEERDDLSSGTQPAASAGASTRNLSQTSDSRKVAGLFLALILAVQFLPHR